MLPIPVNMMFRPAAPSSPLPIPVSPSRRSSHHPNSLTELEASDLERMLPSSPTRRGTLEPSEANFIKELDLETMVSPKSSIRGLPEISSPTRKSGGFLPAGVGFELQGFVNP